MSEEFLAAIEEMVTDEMVEGVTETLDVFETPDFEIDLEVVEDTLIEWYSKGVMHTSLAIGAGFGVLKLLKNRKRIQKTITTFIEKNKEVIRDVKK